MVTHNTRGYLTGAALLLIILWGSGCAGQEQLKELINMPGKIEHASLIAYRASLETCALLEPESAYLKCRAQTQETWKPVIELFEKAHQLFCQVLPQHEVCKAGEP